MQPFKKIVEPLAKNLVEKIQLSQASKELLLSPHIETLQFLKLLLQKNYGREATQVLAFALPHREAIWWAYMCAQLNEINNNHPNSVAARYLIKQWVTQQDEETRLACYAIATANEIKTPSAWAAFAVYWSQSSENKLPPEQQSLANEAVASSIILTTHQLANGDSDKLNQYYQHFIRQGLHIASGGNGKIQLTIDSNTQ